MRLVRRLVRQLLGRPRSVPRWRPAIDSEGLQQIYRETHRHMEDLRRAA
jgi:hypothetical protein